jgi:hypothetical protein
MMKHVFRNPGRLMGLIRRMGGTGFGTRKGGTAAPGRAGNKVEHKSIIFHKRA